MSSQAPDTLEQRTGGLASAVSDYEPRRPEDTLLYQVVIDPLESFLASARDRGQPAPRFIEQELRAYLRCGIPAQGFLRLRCEDCRLERLVPFSCRRRGFVASALPAADAVWPYGRYRRPPR